jgi:hypothetical protein
MGLFVTSIPFTQRIHANYNNNPDQKNDPEIDPATLIWSAEIKTEYKIRTLKTLEKNHGKHDGMNDIPMNNKIKQRDFAKDSKKISDPVFHPLNP